MATCAKTCDCNNTIVNTGLGCVTTRAAEKRTWLMNEVGSTGAKNFIDLTGTLDDTYFSGLVNSTNVLDRLYPLPEIKDISDTRGKPITTAWKDGTMEFVRDGVRTFEGWFPADVASPQLLGILESQRCGRLCKFPVDANGTIWGRLSADRTKLYPLRMDAKSIYAIDTLPTDEQLGRIMYSFNLHPTVKDCEIRGLQIAELLADINPLDYDGLVDVSAKVISCSTTKLVIKLYDIFGGIIAPETIKNLLATNFALTKVASPYTATPTSIPMTGTGFLFAESAGTYSITYPTASAPSSTDHLALTPSKIGYDFTAVKNTVIVVS